MVGILNSPINKTFLKKIESETKCKTDQNISSQLVYPSIKMPVTAVSRVNIIDNISSLFSHRKLNAKGSKGCGK